MLAYANWAAKAVVAAAIPWATIATDLATEWLNITEDGVIGLSEWQAFAISIIGLLGVFAKSNGPEPA